MIAEAILELMRIEKELAVPVPLDQTVDRLLRASQYAQGSMVQRPTKEAPTRGWCSDHPFGRPITESWTSATLLESMMSFQSIVEMANRKRILSTFISQDSRDADWPSWLRWEK